MSTSNVRKAKVFGAGIPQGVPSMDLTIYGSTFKVRGAMSGVRILRIMNALDGAQREGEESTADAIIGFLSDSFLTEDRAAGMDFLENAEPPIALPILTEIVQWLVEQYTGNPTEPAEPSETSSSPAGSGSTGTVSSTTEPTSGTLTDTNSLPSEPLTRSVQ
jgi:hypothetical protein